MLLLFKSTNKKKLKKKQTNKQTKQNKKKKKGAKKPMDEKILWTRRCNVSKLSKKQGILVQENDEIKTLFSMDKTK